jgi:hypothetical protein
MGKGGKTLKPHKCQICGKEIPKGTPLSELEVIEGDGYSQFWVGNDYRWLRSYRYRVYYHKECYEMASLCGKKDNFMRGFFSVTRTPVSVVYNVGGREIEISLSKDWEITDEEKPKIPLEAWNKGVKKYNEIVEFQRSNGLTMHPELNLLHSQRSENCK